MGFPGGTNGKEPTYQCKLGKKDTGLNPRGGKIPWGRTWQPTPVFLPGESHGQRSLESCRSMGEHTVGHDWSNSTHTQIHVCVWLNPFTVHVKHHHIVNWLHPCNRRKRARHNFWKNDIAQGHNIYRLKSNESKMADKSTLIRPWLSISKLNDTPRGAMTVSRHCQKTKEWRWPSPWKSPPLPKTSWNTPPTH